MNRSCSLLAALLAVLASREASAGELVATYAVAPITSWSLPAEAPKDLVPEWLSPPAVPKDAERGLDFTKRHVAILSEGYTVSQREQFKADCARLVKRFESANGQFLRYRRAWSVQCVFTPSEETVSTEPARAPRKTRFGAFVDARYDNVFHADEAKVRVATIKGTNGLLGVKDVVFLLVNLPEGVCPVERIRPGTWTQDHGTQFPCATVIFPSAFLGHLGGIAFEHELGHALYGLGDEYSRKATDASQRTSPLAIADPKEREETLARARRFENVSLEGNGDLFRLSYPVPAQGQPVEGGMGFATGVWHQEEGCVMDRKPFWCHHCAGVIAARNHPRALRHPVLLDPSAGNKKAVAAFVTEDQPLVLRKDPTGVELHWTYLGVRPTKLRILIFGAQTTQVDVDGTETSVRIPLVHLLDAPSSDLANPGGAFRLAFQYYDADGRFVAQRTAPYEQTFFIPNDTGPRLSYRFFVR